MQRDDSILVALATFRRPTLLRECLKSLSEQTVSFNQLSVCVVDNDPERSGRPVVDALMPDFDGHLTYIHEPTPGIPAARNAATRAAMDKGADWIAFIDDDERASPDWLRTLLDTALDLGADGVQGPVIPDFETGATVPVAELGLHEKVVAARGSTLAQASTCNLLLSMRCLAELGGPGPFDVELADVGGSDTELTLRMTVAGAKIVTEPAAVVYEFVPLERQSIEWMKRRAMRTSSTWVAFQCRHNSGFRFWVRRARALNRWVVRSVFYRARHLAKRSELDRMRATIYTARARGQIMGLRGELVKEYARVDADAG